MTEQERAAARRWLEWADDTGKQVIRAAELRAHGFGEADMRTLLHMAFQAGAHAQWLADLEAKASIRAECERLRSALGRLVEQFNAYRAGWLGKKNNVWRDRIGLQDDLDAAGKEL